MNTNKCPHCSKELPNGMNSKWEWDCPNCGHKNNDHPKWLNCEKCHYSPKMAPCPHCKKQVDLFS